MTIAVHTHEDCLGHDPGAHHPENPRRLQVVLEALRASPLAMTLAPREAVLGTDEQILLAHTPEHLRLVRETAPAEGRAALDGDTIMSPGSLDAALRAVGAACAAVDELVNGEVNRAFCATRPPGHHATPDRAMGFCLFNHAAIAALHARERHGLERIALVDFDVHHGNGSQDILAGREGILYVSTHQSPLYPGTGSEDDEVPDNILNVPLPSGTDGAAYRRAFEERIEPRLHRFAPQLVLVSAGFDAHRLDPLAGLALDEDDYRWIGRRLGGLAREHAGGRVLAILEGGYNLEVLGASVSAFLEGLAEPGDA